MLRRGRVGVGAKSPGSTCLTGRPIGAAPPPGAAQIPSCQGQSRGPVPGAGVTPNRPIPSNAGIIATFDQWQYGGTGADGTSFFLVHGATQLTQTGGNGGSLAYAQSSNADGILGGSPQERVGGSCATGTATLRRTRSHAAIIR
jgi:hypothetical protein